LTWSTTLAPIIYVSRMIVKIMIMPKVW